MAQTGYTPIQLYYSSTTTNVPLAANLAAGELAINTADGKLFYKDSGGTVRVIAGTGGSGIVAGSNTQVQYNNNGVFGASANLTFDGTTLVASNLTDSSLTSGRVIYATTGGNLTDSANLTFDGTNLTLGGGTANGVAYLNGSKVLTTGSAFRFDGSQLYINGGAGGIPLYLDSVSGGNANIAFGENGVAKWYLRNIASNGGFSFYDVNTASEAMRLTSSGLEVKQSQLIGYSSYTGIGTNGLAVAGNVGIGTSSPGAKLEVNVPGTTGTSSALRLSRGNGYGTTDFKQYYTSGADYGLTIGNTVSDYLTLNLASGNVGIGTSSPISKLHVFKSSDNQLQLQCDNTGTVTIDMGGTTTPAKGGIRFSDNSGSLFLRTNSTTQLTLDSSGNLGLGVTPSAWVEGTGLNVGSGRGGSIFTETVNYGFTTFNANAYYSATDTWKYVTSNAASRYQQLNGVHAWFTAGSGTAGNTISFGDAKMTLTSGGNLLVGHTSDLGGLTREVLINTASGSAGINFSVAASLTARIRSESASTEIGTVNSAPLIFNTVNTERARISSDGTFRVKGAGTAGSTDAFQVAGAAPADAARITSGGDLLVGTTSNSQGSSDGNKLIGSGAVWVVNNAGNDAFSYFNTTAGAYRFFVSPNGTISATNTTISAISDQRFKENIVDLDVGLNAVMALKPRKFDWKDGKGKNIKGDRGFIAQEFEQVFPDLIDEWKDPAPEGEAPYKSVRQDLIPVLVKAIQELKSELDSVKAELATLKGN